MSILKKNNSVQVVMGEGDITLATGLLNSKSKSGCVSFFDQGVISENIETHNLTNLINMKVGETPVRLIFKNTESIDVLIDQLIHTKKRMMKSQYINLNKEM